jgi:hypothetical protein
MYIYTYTYIYIYTHTIYIYICIYTHAKQVVVFERKEEAERFAGMLTDLDAGLHFLAHSFLLFCSSHAGFLFFCRVANSARKVPNAQRLVWKHVIRYSLSLSLSLSLTHTHTHAHTHTSSGACGSM